MPVLMRVSGGGKKTKDATALPEDVRSGKTFYGKDGKQTGIWTPKVIDFTGDATATPGDVKKGKNFYNNNGKQTGTADIIKSISFKTTTAMKYYQPLGSDAFDLRYDGNGKLYKGQMLLASDQIYRYLETFTLPNNIRVLYLEIDGKKYDGIGNNSNFCITIDHSPDKRLYKLGNNITVTEIKTFTVFYI